MLNYFVSLTISLHMKVADQITKIIRDRRSIFPPMYTGEVIEDSVLWEILENANWAPNHRKTEPWFFVVLTQDKIADFCAYGADWYQKYTPEESFSEIKLKKIKTKALSASHIIAICMKRDDMKRVPQWEEEAAVACAVQNMWLTASALGLGAYWSTPGYAIQGNEFFGLGKGEKCLGLFYLGIPKPDLDLSATRIDIRKKVRWL